MANNTVGKLEDMMHVATQCQGYDPVQSGFVNSIGSSECKSCKNCKHLKENKCESNLYDGVLAGLDQG